MPPVAEEAVAIAPAGTVTDGVYEDGSYPFSVAAPEGWTLEPGAADGGLRLEARHVATQTTAQVWVFREDPSTPRPREGCTWTFQAGGAFGDLHVSGPVDVATCAPDDPDGSLVLDTFTVLGGLAYHIETQVPAGRLMEGREATAALLSGIRIR
jgi:hypothetical protein